MLAIGWARARRAVAPVLVLCGMVGAAHAVTINDDVVQDVRIVGNKTLSSDELAKTLQLKAGGPLTRALVLADVDRIEAAYKKAGKSVAVATDLTHPGEHDNKPVTTLTYTITEGAKPHHYAPNADPLENYYDNTLVCAAAKTLNDLCHFWINRDGSFINFDAGEAKTGHYTIGKVRADGKVPVCQYWDTPAMVSPAEIKPQMGPPPAATPPAGAAPAGPGAPPAAAAAGPGGPGVMICRNVNDRTICERGVDPATLSEEDKKSANLTMGQRFYQGMCYPIGPHEVGDIWFEADDPLPGQLGMDRVLLIAGRQ